MSRPLFSEAAEQSILGALLLKNDALDAIDDRLSERDFHFPQHKAIFSTLRGIIAAGKRCDVVTLTSALSSAGLLDKSGGMDYLAELLAAVPSAAGITQYAKVVADHRLERDLLDAATALQELALGFGDVGERMDSAQQLVFALTETAASGDDLPLFVNVADEFIAKLEKRAETGETVTGLPTGLTDLDERLCGLQPGDLVVLGGRPSMGKTALAMQFACHAAIHDKPALVFSMEMSKDQLTLRAFSNVGRVNSTALRTGKMMPDEWERIAVARGRLHDKPLFIDDAAGLTVASMRARARRQKRRHGLGLIVIDYLQLMSGARGDNRNEQLSDITRGLKLMARELNVPVVLLSQLNRGLEQRPNKRPLMSDLRESGAIEQDADVVLFVYRDEVYNQESPDKGVAEIIVAKQRMGEIGTTYVTAMLEFSAFMNKAWQSRTEMRPPQQDRSRVETAF